MQTGSKILKAGTVSLQHHLPLACLDPFRLWVPAPLSATTCLLARVLVLTVTRKLPCTAVLSWQDMPWLTHPWCLPDPEGHRGPQRATHDASGVKRPFWSLALPAASHPWQCEPKKQQLLIFWLKIVERDGHGGSGDTRLMWLLIVCYLPARLPPATLKREN